MARCGIIEMTAALAPTGMAELVMGIFQRSFTSQLNPAISFSEAYYLLKEPATSARMQVLYKSFVLIVVSFSAGQTQLCTIKNKICAAQAQLLLTRDVILERAPRSNGEFLLHSKNPGAAKKTRGKIFTSNYLENRLSKPRFSQQSAHEAADK